MKSTAASPEACLTAAMRYLVSRPRSHYEIETYLRRKGFAPDHIRYAINLLAEEELVDDMAFAEFWLNNREAFSPRSRRAITVELRRKGVPPAIIADIVGRMDETASAYEAARKKADKIPADDFEVFARKLSTFLAARGFGHGLVRSVVKDLWQERGQHAGNSR